MFLATTALQEFWSSTDETIYLGPWCFRDDEGRGRKIGQCPWGDRTRLHQAVLNCRETYEYILPQMADRLNASLGVSRSIRGWKILLGFWFMRHLHQVLDRQLHVRMAMDEYPALRTDYLDARDFCFPNDFQHFTQLQWEDLYNLQLITIVAQSMGLPGTVHSKPGSVHTNTKLGGGTQRFNSCLLALARGVRDRVAKPAMDALIRLRRPSILLCDTYISRKSLLRIALRSGLDICPVFIAPNSFFIAPDLGRRLAILGSISCRNDFEKTVIATLPYHLPLLYLEGYHSAVDLIAKKFSWTPDVLMSAVAWSGNEGFKFTAAQMYERGTKLVGYQHGGGYGMYRSFEPETLEIEMTDRYYAWGWANEDSRIRNLPYPGLNETGFGDGDNRSDGPILFASNSCVRYTPELSGFPVCSQWLVHMDLQARFVNALSVLTQKRLIARLYPYDYGWNQKERLQSRVGPIRFDNYDVPFKKRLRHCSLFVADNAGTTMIEAISHDVPTIVFWDKEGWEMRPSAVPYFEALEMAGIWHRTPEDAARAVEEAAPNPQAWWNIPARRKASQAFAERFGYSLKDWPSAWIREFKKLAENGTS